MPLVTYQGHCKTLELSVYRSSQNCVLFLDAKYLILLNNTRKLLTSNWRSLTCIVHVNIATGKYTQP